MKSFITTLILIAAATSQGEMMHVIESAPPIFAGLNLNAVSRNMTLVNSRLGLISSAEVTFNDKTLTLVITRKMPMCPEGRACIEMMPAPVTVKLAVVSVVSNQCAIVYVAKSNPNVKTAISEEVTVLDFSYSKCMHTMEMPYVPGKVTYKVTGLSTLTKAIETATAEFNVNEVGFLCV